MESIGRALFVYVFLFFLLRISNKRTLGESTAFDMVLLLIISEATQQALVDGDHSLTNFIVLAVTLIGADQVVAIYKARSRKASKLLDGVPVLVCKDGKMIEDLAKKNLVTQNDILQSARAQHGFSIMSNIRYAVLETDGSITIIPVQGV